jgi:hypothetical protein
MTKIAPPKEKIQQQPRARGFDARAYAAWEVCKEDWWRRGGPKPTLVSRLGEIRIKRDGLPDLIFRPDPEPEPEPAIGESELAIDGRRQIRRAKAFEATTGPPPREKERRPRLGTGTAQTLKTTSAINTFTSRRRQAEFFRAVARTPSPKPVHLKSGQPHQWLGLRQRAANGNPPAPSLDARRPPRARPLSILSQGEKS